MKKLSFLAAFFVFSQAVSAQTILEGRWHLTFDLPDNIYRMTAAFKSDAEGNVKADNLSDSFLDLYDGKINGNEFQLKGKSSYGVANITATINGNSLDGKWNIAFLGGTLTGKREAAEKQGTNQLQVFDAVWQTIDEKFYDPNFNGTDWQAMRKKYRPQAAQAESDGEFLRIVRAMLKELNVSHVVLIIRHLMKYLCRKKSRSKQLMKNHQFRGKN